MLDCQNIWGDVGYAALNKTVYDTVAEMVCGWFGPESQIILGDAGYDWFVTLHKTVHDMVVETV